MGSVESQTKVKTNITTPKFKNTKVSLNKTLNNHVEGYIKDVSTSILDTKSSSFQLILDIKDAQKNVNNTKAFNESREMIEESLEYFKNSYNKSISSFSKYSHSAKLTDFSKKFEKITKENIKSLNSLGIYFNENEELEFNENNLLLIDKMGFKNIIDDNISIFEDIYNQTTDILKEPLSSHMQFKELNLFYNYDFSIVKQSNSFISIQTGMLIDVSV